MEADMPAHNPIGSCCSRPRLNIVGGVDDDSAWKWKLSDNNVGNGARKIDCTTAFAATGILAVLAVVSACALLLL